MSGALGWPGAPDAERAHDGLGWPPVSRETSGASTTAPDTSAVVVSRETVTLQFGESAGAPRGAIAATPAASTIQPAPPAAPMPRDASSSAIGHVSRETQAGGDLPRDISSVGMPDEFLGDEGADGGSRDEAPTTAAASPIRDSAGVLPPAAAAAPLESGTRPDDEVSGLGDELPRATAIRSDLADAVSRETAPQDGRDGPALRLAGPWPKPPQTRIVTIANQKGGVGKTTTTVNLGAALAQHGLRVLVVDLDPQGNASTAFGVDHRGGVPSIYDVLIDGRSLAEVAQPAPDVPGLRCVPATIDLAGAEIELVSVVARESRLRRAIEAVIDEFDYVFIDCPPSLGLLTVNALVAAREVLIPIQCEFYALEGLSQLLRNIDLVRAHLNAELHVSTILLTMYDGRTRLAEQVAAEVRSHFGSRVLAPTIPRSVRISEAPGYGQSVMTYDPASRGAVAYADAAYELALRAADGELS